MVKSDTSGRFLFEDSEKTTVGSVLYEQHLKRVDKNRMADFAGYLMPLWFLSIGAEHNAVRESAGLFDCTHMGILEFKGNNAQDFLNFITTNDLGRIKTGSAQYSYVLDAAGNILDDVIVYKRSEENFMVVVNAANEPKIKAYLEALKNDEVIIDPDKPKQRLEHKPEIRDMRDCNSGTDCRIDIALQGPASMKLLHSLVKEEKTKQLIQEMKSFSFIEIELAGLNCIVTRTGYTGSKIGYELFVHPEKAVELWSVLLEKGQPFGLVPCGLGARDSLRIEAGLPLYGHELAGEFNISPFGAGYGWAVKLEKDFFIGQAAMRKKAKGSDMQVARIELPGQKGVRPARGNDGVLDENGICIGRVLSCAKVSEKQVALVYVLKEFIEENKQLGLYYLARNKGQIEKGKKEKIEMNEKLEQDISGKFVTRFAKF